MATSRRPGNNVDPPPGSWEVGIVAAVVDGAFAYVPSWDTTVDVATATNQAAMAKT